MRRSTEFPDWVDQNKHKLEVRCRHIVVSDEARHLPAHTHLPLLRLVLLVHAPPLHGIDGVSAG